MAGEARSPSTPRGGWGWQALATLHAWGPCKRRAVAMHALSSCPCTCVWPKPLAFPACGVTPKGNARSAAAT